MKGGFNFATSTLIHHTRLITRKVAQYGISVPRFFLLLLGSVTHKVKLLVQPPYVEIGFLIIRNLKDGWVKR